MATQLEKQGYQPAQNLEMADLVILNVCSVRQSAMDRVYAKITQIRKRKRSPDESQDKNKTKIPTVVGTPKIVLTGCLLEKDKQKLKDQVDEIWDIADFSHKPKYQSKCLAYVPIMTGCNNFCSFCVVPYTRGREKSRPAQEIIKEVKNLVKRGYKEIILLGQNVNSYQGLSLETPPRTVLGFPKLLKILNNIPGHFQIHFLTNHPKDISDELIETVAQSEKVVKEIHLPVQSGDDEILKKMNRGYTAKDYKNLVKKIRQKIPGVKISTDVIVGFPGETEKQFQKTVKLFQEIKFDQAYIARYSPRLGTVAAKLKDDVSSQEKKKREKILEGFLKNKGF